MRTKALVQRSVKYTAELVDRATPAARRSGVVVLAYHRVGGSSGLDVDLPLPAFEDQMAALAESGRVVSLDDALVLLTEPPGPPVDAVVLTFDDGTADFADAAMPVLERHRLPATLYVATRFVDEGLEFPDAGAPLSWGALADAVATGLVTVGSHTHRHALLDRLGYDATARELDRSVQLIGDRLGTDVRHFAYPKGLLGSPAAEHAVRRRFDSAAVGGTMPNHPESTDPYRLRRSPIQVSDERRWFDAKAHGGMALEDLLRRQLNRRRYAELSE